MRRFYFHNPKTMGVAYDIYAYDYKDAERRVRKFLGVKRLSSHMCIWEAK